MQSLNLSLPAREESAATDRRFGIRRIRTRNEAPRIKSLTVVSCGSHAMLPPRDFDDYLDPQYSDEAATCCAFTEECSHRVFDLSGYPFSPEVPDVIDDRGAIRRGGELGVVAGACSRSRP